MQLQGLEGLRGRGALELNSQPCDEAQREIHERDGVRIQSEQRTSRRLSYGRQYCSIKNNIKQIALELEVTFSVPDYKESCTSVFTEESRLTGDFCPSIYGIVPAPPADFREIGRIEALDVISG